MSDRTYVLRHFFNRERVFVILTLSILLIFSVVDFIYDYSIDPSSIHLFIELPIIMAGIFGISFVLWKLKGEREDREKIEETVIELRNDLKRVKSLSDKFLEEFYNSIIHQFNFWNLTPTEQQVGLLILKGLSFKEIAAIRQTSERTIRNQALSIYNKSGQSGRHELTAFFIKDIILTSQEIVERKK